MKEHRNMNKKISENWWPWGWTGTGKKYIYIALTKMNYIKVINTRGSGRILPEFEFQFYTKLLRINATFMCVKSSCLRMWMITAIKYGHSTIFPIPVHTPYINVTLLLPPMKGWPVLNLSLTTILAFGQWDINKYDVSWGWKVLVQQDLALYCWPEITTKRSPWRHKDQSTTSTNLGHESQTTLDHLVPLDPLDDCGYMSFPQKTSRKTVELTWTQNIDPRMVK